MEEFQKNDWVRESGKCEKEIQNSPILILFGIKLL